MNGRRLPVRACRVLDADGNLETHHSVDCPSHQHATPLDECCGCTKLHAIATEDGIGGSVDCRSADFVAPRPRVDVAEAAVRVRVGALVGDDTTCVRDDVRVDTIVTRFASSRHRAFPVVDGARRLLGLVSKSDVLRAGRESPSAGTASEIMSPVVHALPEDAPAAYAISLMAFEDLHEVPIVDGDDHVVGMVTATDTLRWLAGALGYVIPARVRGS
jgi:CBS-domain-containing membrane protein